MVVIADSYYDQWKMEPPEPKESACKCSECREGLFPGERIFRIDKNIYCESCARNLFEDEVTDEMAYPQNWVITECGMTKEIELNQRAVTVQNVI